mmetsp:Transcript_50740/g.69631  ORF Transcript_50740/g.69631 Transcript_50740/m.69631 type:complete len:173 (-) Transcript_50740:848-1366(-)
MAAHGSAGACTGACLGAEVLCCEAEGATTAVNWSYVGDGNGGYDKGQTYNFVGEGCGNWEKAEVTTYYGWKLRPCCLGLAAAGILLALLYMFTWTSETTTTTTTTTTVYIPPPNPAPVFKPRPPPPPPPRAPRYGDAMASRRLGRALSNVIQEGGLRRTVAVHAGGARSPRR